MTVIGKTRANYVPVLPREHDASCRRGQNPATYYYAFDRERCERCRALWQRLDDVAAERERRTK